MLIKTLPVGHLGTNCYIVTDEDTLRCAVIDPGAESNTILNYLEENHHKCAVIFVTHAHFDHVTAQPAVQEETGAPVYMSEANVGAPLHGSGRGYKPPEGVNFIKEGDEVTVDALSFKVIETPGHTKGGLCFICGEALFSGDTLFRGSCGRTDMEGGDLKEELRSLKKLYDLPGDYEVYPGHEAASTLSIERAHNPYMRRAAEGI